MATPAGGVGLWPARRLPGIGGGTCGRDAHTPRKTCLPAAGRVSKCLRSAVVPPAPRPKIARFASSPRLQTDGRGHESAHLCCSGRHFFLSGHPPKPADNVSLDYLPENILLILDLSNGPKVFAVFTPLVLLAKRLSLSSTPGYQETRWANCRGARVDVRTGGL